MREALAMRLDLKESRVAVSARSKLKSSAKQSASSRVLEKCREERDFDLRTEQRVQPMKGKQGR